MKKILALLLALCMVLALCACGSTATEAPAAEETAEESAAVEETAEEPAEEETAEEETAVKVGFIFLHDEQSTYDLNFMNAAVAACEAQGVEYVMVTGVDEGQDCYNEAMNLVDEGCNIVFADSFGHEPYLIEAAKECPDVQFCHATGTQAHTVGLDNYHNAFASIYEGRYLAGVAAGLKLQEMLENGEITEDQLKIGYVGAYTYAEVISGYTSFFLGVRSIVPEATMEVTFTGSWYSYDLETEAAQKLIDNGCVLISQHADSLGAPSVCESNGVPNVSYNGSTVDAGPNTYIISSRIDWQPYMEYMIECVKNGEPIAADWTGTTDTGSVVLAELNEAVAAEGTADYLAQVSADLQSGAIHVFDTANFTVDGETLDSYLADVDDLGDYVGETEVIIDGYFHESEFRSAPYFDLMIDGIELLDTAF